MIYPFLVIGIMWLIGLLIGSSITLSKLILIIVLLNGLILVVLSIYLFYKKNIKWFLPLLLGVMLFGIIHMSNYQHNHQTKLQDLDFLEMQDETIGISGYFDTTPSFNGDLVTFIVKPNQYLLDQQIIDSAKEKVLVKIYIKNKEQIAKIQGWHKGMGILLYGHIDLPRPSSNPGQFDYSSYLKLKGINFTIKASSIDEIVVSKGKYSIFSFEQLNKSFERQIERDYIDPYSGFMKGILLGDRSDLSTIIRDDFASIGLSHLLAISGLHLSIFTMLLYRLLTSLRFNRESTIFFIGIFLIGYMPLTGASPSVVRATIMAILTLLGFVYKESLPTLQVIGLTFIGMTVFNPLWIYDIAFQLSFIVTFFLIWAFPYVSAIIPTILPKKIHSLLIVTIIAQLASLPITYYYFHQYSIISVFANLLFVPFFSTIVLPLGIVSLILGSASNVIGKLISTILMLILKPFFEIIHWVNNIEIFRIYGHISIYWLLIVYSLIIWLIVRMNFKKAFISFKIKKRVFWIEKIIITSITLLLLASVLPDNTAFVTFIDVGQGDSILIETPEQYHILIDSGGTISWDKEDWQQRKKEFDVGKDIVLPLIRYKGIKQIDLAVITHEDADHINGFLALTEEIKINRFVVGLDFPRTEKGKELLSLLKNKNIPVTRIENDKIITIDKFTKVNFLPIEIEYSQKENDHGIVALFNLHSTNLFFTGDLEEKGENSLLSKFKFEPVDVLKIGHHGSETSTSIEFLDTIQPKDAIISVGRNNRYHHPSGNILKRLNERNINIWRTDKQGSITVEIDDKGYIIKSWLNK